MKKIIEQNLAEIIVTTVFLICFSSCSQKKCTIAPNTWGENTEKVTQGEYYADLDCANCDEID